MATAQLTLLVDDDWKLDDETRRIGRAGIARARARLAATHGPIRLLDDEAPVPTAA